MSHPKMGARGWWIQRDTKCHQMLNRAPGTWTLRRPPAAAEDDLGRRARRRLGLARVLAAEQLHQRRVVRKPFPEGCALEDLPPGKGGDASLIVGQAIVARLGQLRGRRALGMGSGIGHGGGCGVASRNRLNGAKEQGRVHCGRSRVRGRTSRDGAGTVVAVTSLATDAPSSPAAACCSSAARSRPRSIRPPGGPPTTRSTNKGM